jgi:hypothetical protein
MHFFGFLLQLRKCLVNVGAIVVLRVGTKEMEIIIAKNLVTTLPQPPLWRQLVLMHNDTMVGRKNEEGGPPKPVDIAFPLILVSV